MATEKHNIQLQRWKLLIQEHINSNLTVTQWCKKNEIKKSTYYYWLKQIHKNAVVKTQCNNHITPESSSFVEIKSILPQKISSTPTNLKPSAIIRRNDLEIELFDNSSPTFMRQLFEVIRYA